MVFWMNTAECVGLIDPVEGKKRVLRAEPYQASYAKAYRRFPLGFGTKEKTVF